MTMFTYKWLDEIGNEHGAIFSDGWQRLDCCKAATYHHGYQTNTIDHYTHKECIHEWEWFYLVSYATPIAKVVKHTNYDTCFVSFSIVFDSETFDISRTTAKQLNRFLRKIGCNVSHISLRDAIGYVGQKIIYQSLTQKVKAIDNVRVIDMEIDNACPNYLNW